jgi:FAD/FMN-containing dehydrogenase
MWPEFYRLATEVAGLRAPLRRGYEAYVLVESMGTDTDRDQLRFEEFVESVLTDGTIVDGVVARSIKDSQDIWKIRDSSGEFQKTFWPYVGFDVSIPVGDIGRFIEDCRTRLAARWTDAETVWFGHAADSNIHICVRLPGVDPLPEHQIDIIVYDCVADYSGSISAEHGIGLLKRDYLGKSRSADEIATMRIIKRALDPANILNPGKIFA